MNTSSEAADLPLKPKKWLPLLLACSIPLALCLKMGFFFLIIGMLPTLIVGAVAGNKPYLVSTVAALNFAGVFPELLGITLQGGTLVALMDQFTKLTGWEFMIEAAVLGLAIVWLSPAITLIILETLYRGRIHHMESQQKKLEEEWGMAVTGRKE